MPRSSGAACRQHAAHPTTSPGSCRSAGHEPVRDDVPLERRDPGHEPAERGEELRPLEPDVGSDERHPDELDEHVDDDHQRHVERMASARPRQLHPPEHREGRDRRPLAERLRVGDGGLGAHPVDEVAQEAERVDQVPDRPEDGGDQAEPDPQVDPEQHRRRVGRELLRAEEARGHDLDEEHGRDDLCGAHEPARAGAVEVWPQMAPDPLVGERGGGHRRGDGDRTGHDVQPQRHRELVGHGADRVGVGGRRPGQARNADRGCRGQHRKGARPHFGARF